jgi:predicted nucleotidyltransferase
MHIPPDILAETRRILSAHLAPDVKIWVFGSRAHGRGLKPFSDLDLALEKPDGAEFTLEELGRLAAAFEDSNLPIRVDLADMATLTPQFRAIVTDQRLPLPPGW